MPTGANIKLADTVEDVHEIIRSRWSPRSLDGREISEKTLRALLEAARWAPSSMNEQPWRFLVATKADPEGFNRLLNVLVPANQEWAKNASALILSAAKRTFGAGESVNHHGLHDTGIATGFLMLQATAMGLYAHAMAGLDYERARTELKIPGGYDIGAAIAIGYLASPDKLTNERQRASETSKRARKPLSEIAFGAMWEEPLTV